MNRSRVPWIGFGSGALTFAVAVGAAWLLGYKAAHLPFWPVWVFAAIAAIGALSFSVGLALWALGGLHHLPASHAQMVDNIARRAQPLIDQDQVAVWHTETERQMLTAHRERVVATVEEVGARVADRNAAGAQLDAEIRSSAGGTFPADGFWQVAALRNRAATLLRGQQEPVTLEGTNAIRWQRVTPRPGMTVPEVVWGQIVVWWPLAASPEASSTDEELEARTDTVSDWFGDVSSCEAASEYRDALRNLSSARARLNAALDPVMDLVPIRWSRRCPACNPKRRWQFWR